jgi:hypothetical protein
LCLTSTGTVASAQEPTGDCQTLYLVGTFADLKELGVPHPPLYT